MSWIDSVTSFLKKPRLDFGAIKKKAQPLFKSIGAKIKAQYEREKPYLEAKARAGVSLPPETISSRFLTKTPIGQRVKTAIEKTQIPYSRPYEIFSTPFTGKLPQIRQAKPGKLLTSFLTERPEISQVREKLKRGEDLTTAEKQTARQAEIEFAMETVGGIKQVKKPKLPKIAVPESPQVKIRGLGDIDLNLEHLKTTQEGKEVLERNLEVLSPELSKIKGKTLSHKEVLEEAKRAKMLQGTVIREDQKLAEAALLRTRQKLVSVSDEIGKAGGKASKETWTEYMELLKTTHSYGTEKGRALEAMKIGAEAKGTKETLIKEILKTGADTEKIIKAAMGVDFNNANQAAEFYRKFIKPTIGEKLDYYRYVNMLSSPKTQVINILGNLFQAPVAVGEKLYSGAIDTVASALTGKQKTHYIREVPQYTKGFVNAIPDAMEGFKKALKGETAIYRPDVKRMPVATKGVGRAFGGILRFMEGADVFFQTLFKSAAIESETYKAIRMGKEIAPEAIKKLAGEEALYRVFRQPLGEEGQGAVLKSIDKATRAMYSFRKVPGVKWFVPFVQTPMAILKQGVELSPLGVTTIPGAEDKIAQLAKAALGTTVFMGAGYLALQDRTTWSAPRGEKDKAAFYAAGRKPYAIRIGDKWVQYNKIGPLAYPIAMAAALKEVSKDRGFDKKTAEVAKDVFLEMSKFFTDQSYLSGMSDLMAVVSGEEYALERAMSNIPRQLIPLTSLQGWVARTIDDIYRHPTTAVENVKTGIPFLSKQVEPYRTPTGEVSKRDYPLFHAISPITVGKIKPEFEQLFQARGKASELRKARENVLDTLIVEGDVAKSKEIAEKHGIKLSNEDVKRRAKAEALRLIGEGKNEEAKKIYERFNLSISKEEAEEGKNLYQEIYKALPKSAREAFIEWYESKGEFPGLPMGE